MSILRPFLKFCPVLKAWSLRSQSYRRKKRNQVCPYQPTWLCLIVPLSGLLSVCSSSDKLSTSLYTSCVKLIRHIESQSRLIIASSEPSNARSSREVPSSPSPTSLTLPPSPYLSLPPPISPSLPLSLPPSPLSLSLSLSLPSLSLSLTLPPSPLSPSLSLPPLSLPHSLSLLSNAIVCFILSHPDCALDDVWLQVRQLHIGSDWFSTS